jgi:hypothetical protein
MQRDRISRRETDYFEQDKNIGTDEGESLVLHAGSRKKEIDLDSIYQDKRDSISVFKSKF